MALVKKATKSISEELLGHKRQNGSLGRKPSGKSISEELLGHKRTDVRPLRRTASGGVSRIPPTHDLLGRPLKGYKPKSLLGDRR